jgi:hypothetical protein
MQELDCYELVLSNGMHITYKQTDFMDDEILYSLYANGGNTTLSRAYQHYQ